MTDKEWQRRRYKKYKPIYDEWIKLYPFTTESLDGEIWLPIPYCDDYHMSNFGRVKSCKFDKEKILKPALSNNGYLHVILCNNGKTKDFRVHVLVGKLFLPNPDNKPEVNHVYSNFSNHADCLEWATKSENIKHAFATGLNKSGEEHGQAKLTNEQVLYIRENPDGLNLEQLAEKFTVTATTISEIQLGKKWKDAGGTIRDKLRRGAPRTILDDKRAQILARFNEGGISKAELARQFGVSRKTVWNIVNGR